MRPDATRSSTGFSEAVVTAMSASPSPGTGSGIVLGRGGAPISVTWAPLNFGFLTARCGPSSPSILLIERLCRLERNGR